MFGSRGTAKQKVTCKGNIFTYAYQCLVHVVTLVSFKSISPVAYLTVVSKHHWLCGTMSTSRRSLPASGKRVSLTRMASSAHTNSIELSTIAEPSMVSTSGHSMSSTGHPPPDHIRSPSPPASSYFPTFADTEFGEPQPTPDATSHFAYSTTLRRHHAEPMGLVPQKLSDIVPVVAAENLVQKALRAVRGRPRDEEGGYSLVDGHSTPPRTNRDEKRDTPSARFVHWSVEVCPDLFSLPKVST